MQNKNVWTTKVSKNMAENHGMKVSTCIHMNQVYLVDLHLGFPQLPFIALQVTLELQVVVLKAAD